jgi:hypothetical protein
VILPNLPYGRGGKQAKTIALWQKIAARYANEPTVGGYDILNEPNWGFEDTLHDRNGLKEEKNVQLKQLLVDITNAIREVDKNHIIIIEGNGWGNNYKGMLGPWDKNMVLSFHKYWNNNDQQSIQHIVNFRSQYDVPVWIGETGENSNTWFTEAIQLFEKNNMGWCWWPLKKLGTITHFKSNQTLAMIRWLITGMENYQYHQLMYTTQSWNWPNKQNAKTISCIAMSSML